MNDPLALTEIGINYLSNYFLPIVVNRCIYVPELSCLSPRLGNLLLRKLIEYKQKTPVDSTDDFLSLFNNTAQRNRAK